MSAGEFVAAIDQGTTSTRCLLFDAGSALRGSAQREHRQILPHPGRVEHDAREIWRNTLEVCKQAEHAAGPDARIAALGVTNQRETIVFWNRETGEPYANAIVWQDTRTHDAIAAMTREHGIDRFRSLTGLPLATYFSGPKIAWALENVSGLRGDVRAGKALCGTIDSWLVWNLTGGTDGGAHVTDVTNASRTQLMNLATLDWEDQILDELGIPRDMLPRIVPTCDRDGWGTTRPGRPFTTGVPVCAAVGDQQGALIGQGCFDAGGAKNTYGTGCFLLVNTGVAPVQSNAGLLTTLAYQLPGRPVHYALEGSVAVAGSLVQWLRDNLGLIERVEDIEPLARSVDDAGGIYFVPAFSGLFAPYWRPDARGVLVGLTRFVNKGHIARAVLEATCHQTRDVLEAMKTDAKIDFAELRADGGMVANELLMQLQADVLGIPVVRPANLETTSLGAAYAAGLAVDFFPSIEELAASWRAAGRWEPRVDDEYRERARIGWKKAIERSLDWA